MIEEERIQGTSPLRKMLKQKGSVNNYQSTASVKRAPPRLNQTRPPCMSSGGEARRLNPTSLAMRASLHLCFLHLNNPTTQAPSEMWQESNVAAQGKVLWELQSLMQK